MYTSFVFRVNVKRFPPRLPKLPTFKFPKINLRKPLPHQLTKTVNIQTTKPPKKIYNDNKHKFNVMIAPGNDFELVQSNDADDGAQGGPVNASADALPDYALIVDISKDNLLQFNDNKESNAKTIRPVGMKTVPSPTKEPEIIYGKPDIYSQADVVATAPEIKDNAIINQQNLPSSPPRTLPTYKAEKKPMNVDIPAQDLQDGFMPTKQFAMMNENAIQDNDVPTLTKSTFEQQSRPHTFITLRNQHFGQRPRQFVQPRPLPEFRPQFEELRTISSTQQLPKFQSQFRDVSPNFQNFFSHNFRKEFEFSGFPLNQIHPPSLMNSIATFSSDTDLVDSKTLFTQICALVHFFCVTDVGAISSFSFFRPVTSSGSNRKSEFVNNFQNSFRRHQRQTFQGYY